MLKGIHRTIKNLHNLARHASFNNGLLRTARDISPDEMRISVFNIKDILFYDRDVEAQGDPTSVIELKVAIHDVYAVMFASREYN
jgi:chromate reductase